MTERRDSIGPYRVRSPAGAEARSEFFVGVPQNGAFQSVILRRTPIAAFDSEAALHEYTNAVKLYATLSHSALVQIYEVFTHSGAIVVALEHVEGRSLKDFMNDALTVAPRLPDAAAFFAGLRVFGALAAAHGARMPGTLEVSPVVHGAVRPENILVPWDGYVRLAEFRASQCAPVWRPAPISADNPYQAPEVKRGEAPTVASDIYSAARLLWELLRGTHASAPPAIRGAMIGAPIERLSVLRRDLPKKVTESLDTCLSTKPEERTLSAAQMLSILRSAFVPEEGEQWFVATLEKLRNAPIFQGFSTAPLAGVSEKEWSEQVKVSQESVGLFAWTGEQAAVDEAPTSEQATIITESKGTPQAPPRPGKVTAPTPFTVPIANSVPPGETRSSPRPPPNVGFDPADLVPSVLPSAFPQVPNTPNPGQANPNVAVIQAGPGLPSPAIAAEPASAAKPTPGAQPPVKAPAGGTPAQPAKGTAPGAKPGAKSTKTSSVPLFVGVGLVGVLLVGGGVAFAWSQGLLAGILGKKPVPIAATAPTGGPTALLVASASAAPTATASAPPTASAGASATATAAATATATAVASATASAPPSASSAPPPAGATDAEHTILNTQGAPAGHRIFFDGRVLGEPPNPFTVRCGRHEIRIGSKGAPRNVDLPCGGEYALK